LYGHFGPNPPLASLYRWEPLPLIGYLFPSLDRQEGLGEIFRRCLLNDGVFGQFDKNIGSGKMHVGVKTANKMKDQIVRIANRYHLQIIYAFGSRAKDALDLIEGRIDCLPPTSSDLDIGVKPEKPLTIEEKVEIAICFEDLFNVPRVDVVVIPEAPVFLALEIVIGEILYKQNATYEAEYQLYIMRRAAELLPYERIRQEMILGL